MITHNVRVLSWVSFFADASSEMLYPVFPIFVTQTLGASAAILGLIEGVAEGTASIGMAVSGVLADRIRRRRRMIALGYGISAVAKPLIGLLEHGLSHSSVASSIGRVRACGTRPATPSWRRKPPSRPEAEPSGSNAVPTPPARSLGR